MMTRYVYLCAAAIALLSGVTFAAFSPISRGNLLRVEGGSWQSGGGGEFKITALSGFAGLNGLPSDPLGGDSFQSFCLERNRVLHLGPGSSGHANEYGFVMGTAAVAGGYGGGSPDPISAATAFLYTQFRMGTLSGYAFGGTNEERAASAESLQIAIWTLEDEYGGSTIPAPANAQAEQWVADALAAAAGSWGQTLGLVRVLVLSQNGTDSQDVLTMIPLPPAVWGGLAALGGIVAFRRGRRWR